MQHFVDKLTDKITTWVGSTSSIVLHTLIFLLAFASHWLFGWGFDFILLVLTTVVSLEAIYLAIFIQRAVNQQAVRLHDVEESLDEVEQNLDEVEEALDDAEEDIADIASDTVKQMEKPLDEVVAEIKQLLDDLKKNTDNKKK